MTHESKLAETFFSARCDSEDALGSASFRMPVICFPKTSSASSVRPSRWVGLQLQLEEKRRSRQTQRTGLLLSFIIASLARAISGALPSEMKL